MIKWFAYIGLILILAPFLSSAKIKDTHFSVTADNLRIGMSLRNILIDTTKNGKKPDQDDKKKIKEVAKAKKQPKPEKIEPPDNGPASTHKKLKRQRRPEGLERPPEIPRRNGS